MLNMIMEMSNKIKSENPNLKDVSNDILKATKTMDLKPLERKNIRKKLVKAFPELEDDLKKKGFNDALNKIDEAMKGLKDIQKKANDTCL